MSVATTTHFDVVIVGGGLVGASAALALANTPFRIALIEAALPRCEDARLFALSDSSCALLNHLGVWSSLNPFAAAIREVHISYERRFGVLRLKSDELLSHLHQQANLGYVVPAYRIEMALQMALRNHRNIHLYRPARLQALETNGQHHSLVVSINNEKHILTADKIIAADGTHSTVRTLLNINTTTHDYQQTAIVTRVKLSRSHQHIAYERFVAAGGAIAMLPLLDDECATIWSGASKTMTHLLSLSDQAFLQALQQSFGYRLGRLQSCGERHHYQLKMVRAEQALKNNIMLIGNAAHTLHPIAAQGFNLALYEVAALVAGLIAKQSLSTIYQQITTQLTASIGASHGVASLFADRSGILSAVLPWGMVGLDMAAPIKRHMLARLLGRSRHAPPLLRAKDNETLSGSRN